MKCKKKKAYLCPSYKSGELDAAREFEREISVERTHALVTLSQVEPSRRK
jgi:hypothetical protein